jgi:(5-formylfuran-3-yl)methyl phosphate synthase
MQLLVSVADAADARAAVEGGADIVDAKDPSQGPLGPVTAPTLAAIVAAVAGRRPVSAALGDLGDAAPAPVAGVAFVKSGFVRAARAPTIPGCAVVLAAYADRRWNDVIASAEACGARGVLLDTSDKNGPGLFDLVGDDEIRHWVARAHAAGLTVALAGRLGAADLPRAAALGADIAGVRGAACDGGRGGRVSVAKVRALADVNALTGQRGIASTPLTGQRGIASTPDSARAAQT